MRLMRKNLPTQRLCLLKVARRIKLLGLRNGLLKRHFRHGECLTDAS